MGTGRNIFLVCHVHLQVAGHSRGNNHELFVKRLENYLIIIKRYINRNYYYYYYYTRRVLTEITGFDIMPKCSVGIPFFNIFVLMPLSLMDAKGIIFSLATHVFALCSDWHNVRKNGM